MRIRRLEETTGRFAFSGDNWHMTWADDDRQFVALCDGEGPPVAGKHKVFHNTRVYALRGDLPDAQFEYLPGYPDLLGTESRYYGFGILALDGAVYHFLSTPNRPFNQPEPRFVGAKLVFSPDGGRTWLNQDASPLVWEDWDDRSRANMAFFNEPGDAFSLLSILQMGRGYEDNRDGYVYVFAPNGNTEGTMNQLVMFRVRKDRILDRAAYEFFEGRRADGSAAWTRDVAARGVVHTFPAGWVNTKVHPYAWHPSLAYNAPLGVYMMANWGMGCTPEGEWFGKPSYLGLWTAREPWGPWTQIHEETAWTVRGDAATRAYQPQICPKWIAPDGKSFWLVFTNWAGGYCLNYQKVEILTG